MYITCAQANSFIILLILHGIEVSPLCLCNLLRSTLPPSLSKVVVICGRNKKLLQRLSERQYASGMPVTATGFIDNIHEYMHACDAIITKAGPGTIAEALISGLPILLNGNVPCQVSLNDLMCYQGCHGLIKLSAAMIRSC
jgi:1,2-diacylglycerol 3-beta-galactosyltransferase